MTLRARLTFLYSSLVGGILLIFGIVVYQFVSVILVDQIDNTLAQTANELISLTQTTSVGGVDISVQDLDLATNVYIQFWEVFVAKHAWFEPTPGSFRTASSQTSIPKHISARCPSSGLERTIIYWYSPGWHFPVGCQSGNCGDDPE